MVAISKTFITPKNLRLDTHEKKPKKSPFFVMHKKLNKQMKNCSFFEHMFPAEKTLCTALQGDLYENYQK